MGLTTDEQKAVEQFRIDVVTPSMERLVILDFWAEWCGPCKQMMPILEKVAAEYADRGVILAKVNVDENKLIAAQFQVRSIPTVYAMFQGQPVADLSPARTEPQLRQMLDQLPEKLPIVVGDAAPDPLEQLAPLVEEAEMLLAQNEAEQAYGVFAEVLSVLPEHPAALSGLIRALTALGRQDEGQAIFDSLSEELRSDPVLEKAGSVLSITAAAVPPEELAGLKASVAAAPDDHALRL